MFNSYEELMSAVEERRDDKLVLEIDLGGTFSQEHEDAKRELAQAQALKTVMAGQSFLGDNVEALKAKVEETKPESKSVWVVFKRLSLASWALLVKQANLTPIEQYEKVLPETFVGVYGADPSDKANPAEPLSTNPELLSSKGNNGILPGGALHSVVQAFMAWQNSGGEVTIRPTKSGLA